MHDRGLHPRLVALLKSQGWQGLTQAQQAALPPLQAGKHVLLVAPTGHGKTEAALIPVLSRLLTERDALEAKGKAWPVGFKALYVTPLRALNRDLMARLTSWAEALGIAIGVRHGDTSASERTRQSKNPPDLLITTPETVQLLLYGDTLRRHLHTVRFVILDEVHDLAVSERGAQLLVALERIEEVVAQPAGLRDCKAPERPGPAKPCARPGGGFQRIGVSATVADPAVVAHWLGGRDRDVEVVQVKAAKEIRLAVVHPEPAAGDQQLAGQLSVPPTIVAQVREVRRIVHAHGRVLVFSNTRDGAELLASRSALIDEADGTPTLLGLHHGSLSAEVRQDVEDRFKSGALRALVATSSLELGIDIGAIDHVVQVGSPRSVARLVQRLGRSGHRVGAVSEGTLIATGPEDVLECAAVARRAMDGRLEPLNLRLDPLVVLANQLIALSNEYAGVHKEWARTVIKRAGAFLELDDGLFDAAWDTLLDVKTLYPHEERKGTLGRSGRGRKHFLDHISLIPDEKTYRVIDESAKRSIGTVDDAFVLASMPPGALVVMAGRSWRVLEIEPAEGRVRVAPVKDLGPVPQWSGSQLPVSFDVAQETAHLRGDLLAGTIPSLLGDAAYRSAFGPIQRQKDAGLEVPTDAVVTLEVSRRTVIANVALGTRGNEALGRITAALLHQRLGAAVAVESDAYRIHFTLPQAVKAQEVADVWQGLVPDGLDLLMALVLRDSPLVRHHLVHVARHFGALPSETDPDKFTRGKLDALFEHIALQEETLARLIHDRMDVPAVTSFLRRLRAGEVTLVLQGQGPISFLGQEQTRGMMAVPRSDDALLAAVRQRIEDSDALLACVSCGNSWPSKVSQLPRAIKCRRCSGIQVACLRPWNEDKVPLLRRKDAAKMTAEERNERDRMHRNGAIVGSYGSIACRCLVARGVGPDTAARILQKVSDPAQPAFWREILQAELTFARTNAYWKR
ncbi:MAG: DEAD/DEAH box helicase [Candidatus Thermoplasmatota archaeon]